MSDPVATETAAGAPSGQTTSLETTSLETTSPETGPAGPSVVSRIAGFVKTLLVAAPPTVVALVLARGAPASTFGWIGASVALSVVLTFRFRETLARRLRTVSSVLAAYRDGDYSLRARSGRGEVAFDEVTAELGLLGETLRRHRLGELEAWSLLRKVLGEVDVVVLAVDARGLVKLANNAAAHKLGAAPGDGQRGALVGASLASLQLDALLEGAAPRIVRADGDVPADPGDGTRRFDGWELRRGTFRLSGEPHQLLVLSDVTAALRDNERQAWRRLIRVIGHEINNSLAPIQSIAESLAAPPIGARTDHDRDVAEGLEVIARRSAGLLRFMTRYSELAKLPPPHPVKTDVATLVRKVAALERRRVVAVNEGPEVALDVDADQIEQVLINLVKNAVEAVGTEAAENDAPAAEPRVALGWRVGDRFVEIDVIDDGPGIESANLFVPFFTTKPEGSGIGLVLSRQIAEAHGGQLDLRSRDDAPGALARLRLPRAAG